MMKLKLWAGAALGMVVCVAGANCGARTVTLRQGLNGYGGTADTSIFEEFPSNASGGFDYLFVGVTKDGNTRRTLLKFDLTNWVPPTATVTSVTLQLFAESGRPGALAGMLHRVTRPWNEGSKTLADGDNIGQGSAGNPGDATWSSAALGSVTWTTPGGDFAGAASAGGTLPEAPAYVNITGPGLAQDVQAWAATPGSNNGWLLMAGEDSTWNAKRYYSSEALAVNGRPTLFVEFEAPAAAEDWTLFE